jgi:uncharacterized protein (TIGR02246 family)
MKNLSRVFAVAAIVVTMAGCNQMPDTHDADVAAIKANDVQWNQDMAAKDVDKSVSHYTDDATLMTPGGPPATGKDAIRKGFTEMYSDPAMTLKFAATRVEVAKSGELGFSQGTYTMTMTDPATKQVMTDNGSYVTGYRKQADGSWKAVSDIVTSSVPPPAPAPVAEPAKKKK